MISTVCVFMLCIDWCEGYNSSWCSDEPASSKFAGCNQYFIDPCRESVFSLAQALPQRSKVSVSHTAVSSPGARGDSLSHSRTVQSENVFQHVSVLLITTCPHRAENSLCICQYLLTLLIAFNPMKRPKRTMCLSVSQYLLTSLPCLWYFSYWRCKSFKNSSQA